MEEWRRQEGNGCRYCWDVVETRKMNEWMIEAMKFLERMWFVRCGVISVQDTDFSIFLFIFSFCPL